MVAAAPVGQQPQSDRVFTTMPEQPDQTEQPAADADATSGSAADDLATCTFSTSKRRRGQMPNVAHALPSRCLALAVVSEHRT